MFDKCILLRGCLFTCLFVLTETTFCKVFKPYFVKASWGLNYALFSFLYNFSYFSIEDRVWHDEDRVWRDVSPSAVEKSGNSLRSETSCLKLVISSSQFTMFDKCILLRGCLFTCLLVLTETTLEALFVRLSSLILWKLVEAWTKLCWVCSIISLISLLKIDSGVTFRRVL